MDTYQRRYEFGRKQEGLGIWELPLSLSLSNALSLFFKFYGFKLHQDSKRMGKNMSSCIYSLQSENTYLYYTPRHGQRAHTVTATRATTITTCCLVLPPRGVMRCGALATPHQGAELALSVSYKTPRPYS